MSEEKEKLRDRFNEIALERLRINEQLEELEMEMQDMSKSNRWFDFNKNRIDELRAKLKMLNEEYTRLKELF